MNILSGFRVLVQKTAPAVLLLFVSIHACYAQVPDKAKLDQFFDRLADKKQAMGNVVISKDGQVLYFRSIGYAQVTDTASKPLTAASRFRIASITKMYTAVMILQLAEEKRLRLDDKLSRFFPQIANAGRITIEQILAHRSGIHDALIDPKTHPARTAAVSKDTLVSIIARGTPDFEPGSKHLYSNSGYTLLGLIIEKVTRQSYGEALKKRIVARAGLKDTYTATGNIDVNNNEALTYINIGGAWKPVPETHPDILFGAGFIVSTPEDMTQFIQALFDGKLISPEHLAMMKTMRDGDGWGMEPFSFAGKTFYGHTGGGDNYGAWLAYLPEEKLAVAYTTNAKGYAVGNIMNGILDIYYNKPFEIPTFETVEVSPDILDKYVGIYTSQSMPAKFTVSRNGGKLYIQVGKESPALLEATAQHMFTIIAGVTIEFDAEKKQMTLRRGSRENVFTKEN